jgi:hypothetical protein
VIIVNKNIPPEALSSLKKRDHVMLFDNGGITYPEVSGHPDLFFCIVDKQVILAPNTPKQYLSFLLENNVAFKTGNSNVGFSHPETIHYNAVVTPTLLIHHLKFTDKTILQAAHDKKKLHVNQGYTRCNLLPLPDNRFITSDQGIYKTLKNEGLDVLFIDPTTIRLEGFKHGFIGGTAGVWKNRVLFMGSLQYLPEKEELKNFLNRSGLKIKELYQGPLLDVGSVLVV